MTDKGVIGRDQKGNWTAISWPEVNRVVVRTYDGGRCVGARPCELQEQSAKNADLWSDPLAWIIPFGLFCPCCGYVCIRPDTPGLYHAIIISKRQSTMGNSTKGTDYKVPTATIDLIGLAASPEELVETLKRASDGIAPAKVKGLTMER